MVRRCRFWANADSGLDIAASDGAVTVEESWAFDNGHDLWQVGAAFQGDGDGIVLSGSVAGSHRLVNNLAWGNAVVNFNCVLSGGVVTFHHNTSFCEQAGPTGLHVSGERHMLVNNISWVAGKANVHAPAEARSNSWNAPFDDADPLFISTNPSEAAGPRQPDGGLPRGDFLRLGPGSPYLGAAEDVGHGKDLGASAP